MSIFSNHIVEDIWVGMAYEVWNYTNPIYKNHVWDDAFDINFSKTKMREAIERLSRRDDGSIKISEVELREIIETLSQHSIHKHSIHKLRNIYKYIILICLIVPSLDEQNLSNILTSCLKQTKISKGNTVTVKIKFPEREHTFIVIHVNTFTPQRIEIVLKRK